jgi:hypothetical protein
MNVFSNIHELCGSVMQEHINSIVKKEIDEYNMKFEHNYAADIRKYRTKLLSMTDVEFNALYHNIYQSEINEINDIKVLYLNYVCAILSDIKLVKKCINTLNELLKRIDIIHKINSMISHECIMLLIAHNFDNTVLLSIVYQTHDYVSMKYIINIMSFDELMTVAYNKADMFNINCYKGLIEILFMDKLYKFGHNYALIMHYNYDRFIKGYNIYARAFLTKEVIVECYYVIRYMTQAEGKIHMTKRNEKYNELISRPSDRIPNTTIYDTHELYNSLLEYHFRPRGSHTKSASNNY